MDNVICKFFADELLVRRTSLLRSSMFKSLLLCYEAFALCSLFLFTFSLIDVAEFYYRVDVIRNSHKELVSSC